MMSSDFYDDVVDAIVYSRSVDLLVVHLDVVVRNGQLMNDELLMLTLDSEKPIYGSPASVVQESASKTVPPDMFPQRAPILKFFFAWFQTTALHMVHQCASRSKFTHFGKQTSGPGAPADRIWGLPIDVKLFDVYLLLSLLDTADVVLVVLFNEVFDVLCFEASCC